MPKTRQALPINKKTPAGALVRTGPIQTLLKMTPSQPSPRTARARVPKWTSRTEGEVGIPASRIAGMPLGCNCTWASTTVFPGSAIPPSPAVGTIWYGDSGQHELLPLRTGGLPFAFASIIEMVLDIGKLYLLRTMQSHYFPVNMLVCVIPRRTQCPFQWEIVSSG